ncbi:MAG TPA: CoA-binding protein [Acidobacteriota bacterium]|nr:CoA-binding protein [Acidobacteriota bacterium]
MERTNLLLESEDDVAAAVRSARVVAVVGMKDGTDPDAAAWRIPAMMEERGIRVIPVNPKFRSIAGRTSYPRLADVPEPFDAVDFFRAPRFLSGHTDEILALPPERRPSLVWFQSGIRDDASAARLAAAGIRVVQDHCMGVYARKYRESVRPPH